MVYRRLVHIETDYVCPESVVETEFFDLVFFVVSHGGAVVTLSMLHVTISISNTIVGLSTVLINFKYKQQCVMNRRKKNIVYIRYRDVHFLRFISIKVNEPFAHI